MDDAVPAVEAAGLRKAFGAIRAVDGVDLAVAAGSVHGFLGPNGAGKTTTLRMLATLLLPDAGTMTVLGHDVVQEPAAVRRRVSLTGQHASMDDDLTGGENLVLMGLLWGLGWKAARSRADELLERFGLADAGERLVKTYSGGMQRRLDIAASLVVVPELLFLDEPTTGLDPRSRSQVWDMVRRLVGEGTTVLLTTQYLEEIDRLADRITVIDRGRVIAEGSSAELKAAVGASTLHVRLLDADRRPDAEAVLSRALDAPVHADADPAVLAVQVPDGSDGTAADVRATAALYALSGSGIALSHFTLGQPSLDEVFLALTGHRPDPEPTREEARR